MVGSTKKCYRREELIEEKNNQLGVRKMDKLKELALRKEKLTEEIENFRKFNIQVYEKFLQEYGLDEDVEMLLWIKGEDIWKRGRICIARSYSYNYAFEFHTYKKDGDLSSRTAAYMDNPEYVIQKINCGTLRRIEKC